MSTVQNFLNFTSSLLMLFFVQPLSRNCYKLPNVVTFTFIQICDQNFVFLTRCRICLIQRHNLRYFRCPVWKTKSWQKSKCTWKWKLKHANSILETFEYFCQTWSKSIRIILSYTISKLVHFLRHSVHVEHAPYVCTCVYVFVCFRRES